MSPLSHLAGTRGLGRECTTVPDFVSLRSLLPDMLARLSDGGSTGALQTLWREVIGGPIAQNSCPTSLSAGVLRVDVTSVAWRTTLQSEEPALRARLNAALRNTSIQRLEFEVRPLAP